MTWCWCGRLLGFSPVGSHFLHEDVIGLVVRVCVPLPGHLATLVLFVPDVSTVAVAVLVNVQVLRLLFDVQPGAFLAGALVTSMD